MNHPLPALEHGFDRITLSYVENAATKARNARAMALGELIAASIVGIFRSISATFKQGRRLVLKPQGI